MIAKWDTWSTEMQETFENARRWLFHWLSEGWTVRGVTHCRCCSYPSPPENLQHILTSCSSYSDIRVRMFKEYEDLCKEAKTKISFNSIVSDNSILCQFLLDPASFNLANRIHLSDPILGPLFKLSRDYCHAVNSARKTILTSLAKGWRQFFPLKIVSMPNII